MGAEHFALVGVGIGFLSAFGAAWTGLRVGMPTPRTRVRNVPVRGEDSSCLRVLRYASYTVVHIPLGTPPKIRSLLLEFEVQPQSSAAQGGQEPLLTHLISPSILQSSSLICTAGGSSSNCSDVAYFSRRPGASVYGTKIRFAQKDYALALYDAQYTIAYSLGLDGVLYIRKGTRYWLTDSHLCAAALSTAEDTGSGVDPDEEEGGLLLRAGDDGALVASVTDLGALVSQEGADAAVYGAMPVAQEASEPYGACTSIYAQASTETAVVFISAAALEQTWLSLKSSSAFRGLPASTRRRRRVVELGVTCARDSASTQEESRAVALYETDCESGSTCRTAPSVPYRRFATSRLLLDVFSDGNAALRSEKSATLEDSISLGEVEDSQHSLLTAVTSFVLIVVAALVTFVRSQREDLESSMLFCASVQRAFECLRPSLQTTSPLLQNEEIVGSKQLTERAAYEDDEFVAVLAVVARLVTVGISFSPLQEDGFSRLVTSEILGCVASTLHYIMRFHIIRTKEGGERPITKLGGPTAMVDATASVMLSFCSPPLFAPSGTRFEPTARLLIAILISVEVLPRCIFSCASCAVRFGTCRDSNRAHASLLFIAGVQWCVQSLCAIVLLLDAVCAPAALEFGRTTPAPVFELQATAFLMIVCAGLPRLASSSKSLLSECVERD